MEYFKKKFKFWLIIFTSFFVTSFVICAGIFIYYTRDLPDYTQLANYKPPALSRIYSSDGKLIEEYAKERRIFVPIAAIPQVVIDAFIAAEDRNFYNHPGVDLMGLMRAVYANIINFLQRKNKLEGASTITQQVVKNFLLSSEQSIERKVKEAVLSYMISEVFTKDQILELYLNQIYLGNNSYGIVVAAQSYFNKTLDELNYEEAALLAGLPKAPSYFNPYKHAQRAKWRRDYVLRRMLEDQYISESMYKVGIDTPIILSKRDSTATVVAPYFAEQVRSEVIKMLGQDTLYNEGLTIITTLKPNLQLYSEQALRAGLIDFDTKKGFRGALAKIDTKEWTKDTYKNWLENLRLISDPVGLLDYELAAILNVNKNKVLIGLKNGTQGELNLADLKWAKYNLTNIAAILNIGDVVAVQRKDQASTAKDYYLRQIPSINGAIIVMEPITGKVLAMVGGYDYKNSQFNRATQALRQPGSTFKPFVYLAALESGIKPNAIFNDGPIEISQGQGLPSWRPKNFKGDFLGDITLREGLEKSRNLITVRIAQKVGLAKIREITKRFGLDLNPPNYFSMVLGSIETTLEKIVTSYSVLANKGQVVQPHYIEMIKDRNGKILYRLDNSQLEDSRSFTDIEQSPNVEVTNGKFLTDSASAYQICSILNGAVQRGTGQRARKLGLNISGKTGTTNEGKDTYFIGISPDLVVGTFVGYDNPHPLGSTASGATVALPIFVNFMTKIKNIELIPPFAVPKTIKLVNVNRYTGFPEAGPNSIIEAFKNSDNEYNDESLQNSETVDSQINSHQDDENNDIFLNQ